MNSPTTATNCVLPVGPVSFRSQVAVPLESVSAVPARALQAAGGVSV